MDSAKGDEPLLIHLNGVDVLCNCVLWWRMTLTWSHCAISLVYVMIPLRSHSFYTVKTHTLHIECGATPFFAWLSGNRFGSKDGAFDSWTTAGHIVSRSRVRSTAMLS